jgi:hypothetical protein
VSSGCDGAGTITSIGDRGIRSLDACIHPTREGAGPASITDELMMKSQRKINFDISLAPEEDRVEVFSSYREGVHYSGATGLRGRLQPPAMRVNLECSEDCFLDPSTRYRAVPVLLRVFATLGSILLWLLLFSGNPFLPRLPNALGRQRQVPFPVNPLTWAERGKQGLDSFVQVVGTTISDSKVWLDDQAGPMMCNSKEWLLTFKEQAAKESKDALDTIREKAAQSESSTNYMGMLAL